MLTIGSFDGVHRGHAALIAAARRIAGASAKVVALAFDPHPLELVNPSAAPARLTRFEDRERWLKAAGADEVVRLHPTPERLSQTAAAFIESKVSKFNPIAFVEGADFRFGKGREGDVDLLAKLGERFGFKLEVVDAVEVVLDDHAVVKASSTLCRWLVKHGRVRDAGLLLGRPYRLGGEVVRGDRRGRTIGFPTANVATEVLLPADGVYAARALLPDGRALPAAINVGERPTFTGAARTVEAHIIQEPPAGGAWAPLTGLPEYGWRIELELLGWIRDQFRFAGIGALQEQLRRDCLRAIDIFAGAPSSAPGPSVHQHLSPPQPSVPQGALA